LWTFAGQRTDALNPKVRARARAVADTIVGDGALRAAKLLLEAC
jgi:hypothetical protein